MHDDRSSKIQTTVKGASLLFRQDCNMLETVSIASVTITRMVDTIDVNHVDVNDKYYDMFNTWLSQTCDPCWCQVASVFKMLYLNHEAREILKLFLHCKLMCPDSINL